MPAVAAKGFNPECSTLFRKNVSQRLSDRYDVNSHNAVIRVYDEAGNVIETYEHAGDFKSGERSKIIASRPATSQAVHRILRARLLRARLFFGCISRRDNEFCLSG